MPTRAHVEQAARLRVIQAWARCDHCGTVVEREALVPSSNTLTASWICLDCARRLGVARAPGAAGT